MHPDHHGHARMPDHRHGGRPRLLSRRAVLIDMGGLFAGALVLSGCSSSSSVGSAAADSAPTSSAGSPSTAGAPSTPAGDDVASDDVGSEGPASWERVNMGFVSAYILVRAGEAIIVDTGPSGNEEAIGDTLTALGVGWGEVADVILTHRHPDHVGSLAGIIDLAPQAALSTGAADVDAIGADLGLRGLADGETVNGLDVIATPGHTVGHISMLDRSALVLLAGDAINGADGGVVGPNPDFTPDMTLANASMQLLAEYDYQTILFGHGEPVTSDGSALVAALASSAES